MKQSGAWVSILALFGVGILIGGLATHLLYATGHLGETGEPSRSRGRGGVEPRERVPLRGADSLESLDLTSEQRQALRKIIEETRIEGREMRESWRPQIQSLLQNAQERISELLTEEQRSRWSSLREQQPLVLERMFLGGRGGPPRPRGGPGGDRPWGKAKGPRPRRGPRSGPPPAGPPPEGPPPGGGI